MECEKLTSFGTVTLYTDSIMQPKAVHLPLVAKTTITDG